MLKLLRERSIQKKVFLGLTVIVVLSFVISGVMVSTDEPGVSGTLAKLNGRKIDVHEYLGSYRAVQRQAQMMYGERMGELAGRFNFKTEAWDRMLMLEAAKQKGIRADNKEVIEWVAKQQSFQRDGKFDKVYYDQYIRLGYRGTARQFEEEIRQMLTIGKWQQKGLEEFKLTDEELKNLYKEEKLEKDLVYGLVALDSITVPEPSENQIKELDKIKSGLTDDAGKALSKEAADQKILDLLKEGPKREIARKKLEDAKAKITSPADFESVLKADGITVERLAKYRKGTYPAGIWPSESLQNEVAELGDSGGVSHVFDVPKGAMIVRVETIHPFDQKKFEEEKTAFKEQMEATKAQQKLKEDLEKMRENLQLNVELMKELFPAD
jgi:hypothetical protein